MNNLAFVLVVLRTLWPGLEVEAAVATFSKEGHRTRLSRGFIEKVVDAADKPKGLNKLKDAVGGAEAKEKGNWDVNNDFKCGETKKVDSKSNKYDLCPTTCPYFAQNKADDEHCTFVCVPREDCAVQNANKPIADTIKQSRTCRGPVSQFCDEPYYDGTDSCKICQAGFDIDHVTGQCHFAYWKTLAVVGLIVLVVVLVLVVWIVDWCNRPTINEEAVLFGEQFRTDSKILRKKSELQEGDRRTCYDLSTNLCNTDIAGPGMLLHFRFQLFMIIWPLVVALVWMSLASVHPELWILGTRKFGTPRHNCILVAWGYETQHRLMWTKNLFLAIVYVFSFVSFLLFSIWQNRTYQEKCRDKSMRDFAVEVKGLPALKGSDKNVEKDIQEAIEKKTNFKLVGISVAWNYMDLVETVEGIVAKDQLKKQSTMLEDGQPLYNPRTDTSDPTEGMSSYRKKLYNFEKGLLGYGEVEEDKTESEIVEMLDNMVSSDCAIAVFRTEGDMTRALKENSDGIAATFQGKDCTLTLHDIVCEPATVNWHNFGDTGSDAMMARGLNAMLKYYVPALLIWFVFFYIPYAGSLMMFNYDNGAELPGFYGLIFTMVVVGGNATMYFICDVIGDKIGFKYKDSKQCAYLVMYLVACMINVLLDMGVTYKMAYMIMTGLDFKTYHGKRLSEIDSYAEQFETYAMQRSLGSNAYAYAWPSTFLVPFLLEPFVTIVVPYSLGRLIVRTHKEVQGADAEAFLAAFDFDLGRYADILLNVFLGILIFWFPGGYTWSLFLGMSFSHCVIYAFDHYRVLHVIPSISIVSDEVDLCAQYVMIGCCGMILSALTFKLNCEEYGPYCIKSTFPLVLLCTATGVAHCIVHYLLFKILVPKLANKEVEEVDTKDEETYESVAKDEAKTWFSVNPVHCLRSQYKQGDKPYCRFISVGKDHLAEKNDKIGCIFYDPEPPTREIISFATVKDEMRRLTRTMTRGTSSKLVGESTADEK